MSYTSLVIAGVLVTLVLDLVVLRTQLLTRRGFWVAYSIVLVFQLITNGVLTGWEVVRYAPSAIMGGGQVVFVGDWRVAYAPVEDLLFGFVLVTQTLVWWVWWGRRGLQYEPVAGPPRWRLTSGITGRS
jgi:lycopene cyclase domain-containing protein